jgi:hypothetical protein
MNTPDRLSSDERGVSIILEYILIIGILAVFMGVIVLQLNDIFIETPTRVAMKNQFQDIGNQIATKLTDISLIAPDNGYIRAKVYMPYAIGDYDYRAEFTYIGGDYVLKIESDKLNKIEYVPLNNLALQIIPMGYTISLKKDHELIYTSSTHLKPTAVALAYPTKVEVGTNVTFDMTYSTGEGDIWYQWDFGDGNSANGQYDSDNPSNSLEDHSYNVAGNYTATLTVWDALGYSDTDSINITVLPSTPDPFLHADKFVTPDTTEPNNPVRITLYIRGGGIVSTARNISVIHVTDVSGSMDPDYYGDNGYTLYTSNSGTAIPSKWESNITVDGSFSSLTVMAYSNNGKDVDLWVKSPDGDFARAQYLITNGELYYVQNPVEGEWTIAVVADYPTDSDTVNVDVEKNGYFWGWWYISGTLVSSSSFVLNGNATTFNLQIPSVENLKIEATPVNGSKVLHLWVEKGATRYGPYSGAYEESNGGGNYTAYVVADFPYGTQDFYLYTSIAKIDAAKITAKTFNGFLRGSDQVGVVSFGGTGGSGRTPRITLDQPLTNDTNQANSSIDGLWAYGGTPLGGGIKTAREELVANTTAGNIPVMIILSDGNPTITSSGQPSETLAIQEALDEANVTKQTTINNESILIYTIGFGPDANATLLKEIASSPNNYYFAATSEELQSIYEQIARELREKAAQNVTVTDVLPPDVILSETPSGANVTYSNGTTIIRWEIPSIRINETWTVSFLVTPTSASVTETNVPNASNVTFLPFPFVGVNFTTIYLPPGEINVTSLGAKKVELQ